MTDPTDTWRATFAASGQSTSAQLRQTQAELTAMREQRDEARIEAHAFRAQADHYCATAERLARGLHDARRETQRLQAELGSALRRLNELGAAS